jgi:hypothetical protein
MYRKFKNLFLCRELYRRTGESSSERVFGESCGFASLGSGDAAVVVVFQNLTFAPSLSEIKI